LHRFASAVVESRNSLYTESRRYFGSEVLYRWCATSITQWRLWEGILLFCYKVTHTCSTLLYKFTMPIQKWTITLLSVQH